jgi:hypothetical protein
MWSAQKVASHQGEEYPEIDDDNVVTPKSRVTKERSTQILNHHIAKWQNEPDHATCAFVCFLPKVLEVCGTELVCVLSLVVEFAMQ